MKLPSWINTKVVSILGLCLLGAVLFFGYVPSNARKYQGFRGRNKEDDTVLVDTSKNSMFPFTTEPINDLDQYELEAVFVNEGDRELKQTEINQMTRRYPLDWSNYPPNSSKFQSEQAKYIEGFSADSSATQLNEPYQAIGDGNLTPPNTIALEKKEKEILSTYAPKKANDLKTYDLEDAQELIEKIYQTKGLKPSVQRKEGNVFEITGVRPIKEKIQYEDELPVAPWNTMGGPGPGEATIEVPAVATEMAASRDPFYDPTTSTRSNRSDYTKWTPGLERSFAPTYPTTDWINQPKD